MELELLLDLSEGAGAVRGFVHARERLVAEVFTTGGFFPRGGESVSFG